MADLKAFLTKLHQNLNILKERAAKYAGNTPLDLLNQISDHQEAIALTEQALANELSETDWQEALQPLNLSLERTTNIFQVFLQSVPIPFMIGTGVALSLILGLGVLSLEPVRVAFFATATPTITLTPTATAIPPPTPTATPTPTPTPARLTGDFNIAVAPFQVVGQGDGLDDAEQLSQNFTNAMEQEVNSLVGDFKEFNRIGIAYPAETGLILGETVQERAENALSLAETLGADVVIYGTIKVEGLHAILEPEFYVNIIDDDNDQFVAAAELTGQYRMGEKIETFNIGDRLERSDLSEILVNRFRALTLIIQGMAHFDRGSYEQAENNFSQALDIRDWNNPDVIYVLLGNTAIMQDQLAEAEAAYRQALDKNPKYARAYGGLAQAIYFQLFTDAPDQAGNQIDLAQLDEVIATYQQALDPNLDHPPLANVTTRVNLGLGQAYLLKADALYELDLDNVDEIAENYELAFASFEAVIQDYEAEHNPRLSEIAAYAHANLGAIYHFYEYFDEAILEYTQALELLPPFERSKITRAIYEAAIGDIYIELVQMPAAIEWYEKAVVDAAIKPELQQQYQETLNELQ